MSQSSKRNQKAEFSATALIKSAQVTDAFDCCGAGNTNPILWDRQARNTQTYIHYLNWITDLAINRFKWEGLPDTCNLRFLEWTLLTQGFATIARATDSAPIMSLRAAYNSKLNAYGEPLFWQTYGYGNDSTAMFNVQRDKNGVLIYDNVSWLSPWVTIQLLALDLTQTHLTEMQNLAHQRATMIITAPQEQTVTISNQVLQMAGFEPITVGYDGYDPTEGTKILTSGIPYIGDKMGEQKTNKWNEILSFLGIKHLAFEKGERMIEQEAEGNAAPTNIMLQNCLKARQDGAEAANKLFGTDIRVKFNDDLSSYNMPNEVINNEAIITD